MVKVNENFFRIEREYIFPVIEKKLDVIREKQPHLDLCNLGIGDISKPLSPLIAQSLTTAAEEMVKRPIGYGPATGYDFLKKAISSVEYPDQGFANHEIFISDGILSDAANLQELFAPEAKLGLPNPTYPAYLDANILAGRDRTGPNADNLSNVVFFSCNQANNFRPCPPSDPCQLIYLCSPNNPTGSALRRDELQNWITYAKQHRAVILFDAAYVDFISSPEVPKTIYELPGAKEVAIEMRSFSKSAGFTGLRCAYSIIPKELVINYQNREIPLCQLWRVRQNSKYNGTAYIVQRAAQTALSQEGRQQAKNQIQAYRRSASILIDGLLNLGFEASGGIDSPYVWWKIPTDTPCWEFFDLLLEKCRILSVPGIGFGSEGEGYIRLSGFADPATAEKAINRISNVSLSIYS